LLSFPDPNNEHPLFWANDIECYINNYSCGYFIFDFLSDGKLNTLNGKYYLTKKDVE